MFKHNFKSQVFEGTLFDLMFACNPHLVRPSERLKSAARWIDSLLTAENEILPIRKHNEFSKRGQIKSDGGRDFVAVDNELLADLLVLWLDPNSHDPKNLKNAICKEEISLSWKLDVPFDPKPALRGSPVKSAFREAGLKIAHILNAGDADGCNLYHRFIRTLHPYNIFLFPSSRLVKFEFITTGTDPGPTDLAEDSRIQKLAWQILYKELVDKGDNDAFLKSANERGFLSKSPDYVEWSKKVVIKVTPKEKQPSPKDTHKKANGKRSKKSKVATEPSIEADPHNGPAHKGRARDCAELLEWLRNWLIQYPNAKQLNGKTGNAPDSWICFELQCFNSPADDFKTRHDGQEFLGDSYNGEYFLPGDFKADKARILIDLLEESDCCCDVFQTSATFETGTLRRGSSQKRRLVPRGYRNAPINGCYIYKKP